MMKLILYVKDDRELSKEVNVLFESNGYYFSPVKDNKEAYSFCRRQMPDIIFLKDKTEDHPSLFYQHIIRSLSDKVIIVLMGDTSVMTNIVAGLDALADNYISDGCDIIGILAYAQAFDRRFNKQGFDQHVIKITEDLSLNTKTQELQLGEKKISLSRKKYLVLKELVLNKGTVVKQDVFFKDVWEFTPGCVEACLRRIIKDLRMTIKDCACVEIKTYHGMGYMLRVKK